MIVTAGASSPTAPTGTARVAVGTLGGTIAMTTADAVDASGASGVTPTLGAADLLGTVPGLAGVGAVTATTLRVVPGASLSPDDVLDAVRWARAQVQDGATGVVLVQGTDTLEETAYLASLYWDVDAPLVFTGAMRPADAPSADGPANLLAACQVAASPAARGVGVVVVMDQVVHAASSVYKSHTFAVGTMRSRDRSTLGQVLEGRVHVRPAVTPAPLALDEGTTLADVRVPALTTYLGDTGAVLDAVLALEPHGLVVAGFGVGHVSAGLAHRLEDVCARLPVVYASRVPEGRVGRWTYDFVGSEMFLQRSGAIPAGGLSAPKARLLLAALLAAGVPHADVRPEFEERSRA